MPLMSVLLYSRLIIKFSHKSHIIQQIISHLFALISILVNFLPHKIAQKKLVESENYGTEEFAGGSCMITGYCHWICVNGALTNFRK